MNNIMGSSGLCVLLYTAAKHRCRSNSILVGGQCTIHCDAAICAACIYAYTKDHSPILSHPTVQVLSMQKLDGLGRR